MGACQVHPEALWAFLSCDQSRAESMLGATWYWASIQPA